ncbi:MAG: 4-hydroxy-tetrahydrodipicolinate reductase [Clostridia bacterium]|nr:4-hydroxy-tetrahydrodipicolinate reductase [Clostridia bacterium]
MKIILAGYGQMGKMLESTIDREGGHEIIGVVHPGLFETPFDIPGKADVLIDFSYPGNLETILRYGKETGCALVIGTTGLNDQQIESIREASKEIPIVFATNYSLGVAALRKAVSLLAGMLMENDFDAEIVETHHHKKADAPSGTAKTLLSLLDPNDEYEHVYGRSGQVGARKKEIGIHAVRGGTVAGEHSVFFFGEDETIELRHSASSRQIFVNGAIRAAKFVVGRKSGLFSTDDVLGI